MTLNLEEVNTFYIFSENLTPIIIIMYYTFIIQ